MTSTTTRSVVPRRRDGDRLEGRPRLSLVAVTGRSGGRCRFPTAQACGGDPRRRAAIRRCITARWRVVRADASSTLWWRPPHSPTPSGVLVTMTSPRSGPQALEVVGRQQGGKGPAEVVQPGDRDGGTGCRVPASSSSRFHPGQRAGSTTVIPATVARSNTGSRAAASSRPMVRSTSRCGCSDPCSTSAIIAG